MARISIPTPIRSAEQDLLDTFLVSAIATLLLIRIYLEAAGYPQLGGDGLHIAHVLWGGLGMLLAIVMLLLFLTSTTRLVAAIIGGAGFGAFIDELGKFLTSDNNYFFQPTAALVYAVFVVLFLASREIGRFRRLSPEENLVNAAELSKKLATDDLSEADREHALRLLDGCDPANPLAGALRERFLAARLDRVGLSRLARARNTATKRYAALVANKWFRRVIAALFILVGLSFVIGIVALAAVIVGSLLGVPEAQAALDEASTPGNLAAWIQQAAGVIGGILIIRGVLALRHSLVKAYRAFELAILVDLMLNLPFAFLQEGFVTTIDVFIDLALLAMLRYMQAQERALLARSPV